MFISKFLVLNFIFLFNRFYICFLSSEFLFDFSFFCKNGWKGTLWMSINFVNLFEVWMSELNFKMILLQHIWCRHEQLVSNSQLFFKLLNSQIIHFWSSLNLCSMPFIFYVLDNLNVLLHLEMKHFDGRRKDICSSPFINEVFSGRH